MMLQMYNNAGLIIAARPPSKNLFFCRAGVVLAALCTALLGSTPAAYSSARTLPPEPLEAPQFAAPVIRMPASTAPSTSDKKSRTALNDTSRLVLKPASSWLQPANASTTCPTETPQIPEPGNAVLPRAAGTLTPLDRLRATASGTVQAENRQLSKPRLQRMQAIAAWQMGLLTLHGICTTLNTQDAAVWFERAHALGEAMAPAGLAWCEIEGCKSAPNPAAATRWIELLRPVDAPRAQYLQWLVQTRLAPIELAKLGSKSGANLGANLGASAPADPIEQRNRQLLANAARLGDTNARIEMGLDSVFANNLPQALAFFNSAGTRSVAATVNSGVMTERLNTAARAGPANRASTGTGTTTGTNTIAPVKPQSALENFTQAQRYHRGQGVPSNYTEAIRLYQLAKNQGSVPAAKMLELIFSRPTPDGKIDLIWMQQLATVEPGSAVPQMEAGSIKQKLKREPTPLFELVPDAWRRFGVPAISA